MEDNMQMGPEEMAQKRKMVMDMCICRDCPSYVDCQEEIGYCFHGKSGCIEEEKGCICLDCPVTAKMGLRHGYYCTRGSEMEQKGGGM